MFSVNFLINVFVFSVLLRYSNASKAPHVFQYYRSTKYTAMNPQSKRFITNKTSSHFWNTQLDIPRSVRTPAKLPNKLNYNDDHETETALIIPNNPVPMLHPNPFLSNDGLKRRTSKTSNKSNTPEQREEGSFCRHSFDGRYGYCIQAYQCLHVIRSYREHGAKIDVCTYKNNIPIICCPLEDKHIDEQRISAKKCHEYHDVLKDVKLGHPPKFSGKLCVPSMPMIVGGHVANKGEDPHMAALGWSYDSENIRWGCGGALISDKYVLSAAHCATSSNKPPDVVRLGASNLNEVTPEQQDIRISIIILHPKYRTTTYYYDIALLKLAKRVHFSQLVRPACLWQVPDMKMHTATAAGWGRTEFLGSRSEDLQKVDLNMIDQNLCKQLYRRDRRLPRGIIDAQFCAGHLDGGKDTCQGDSGGPLYVELPELKCVKFVVGITSFGKFCAAPNAPGVYTKIYAYLDWIEKIVFKEK